MLARLRGIDARAFRDEAAAIEWLTDLRRRPDRRSRDNRRDGDERRRFPARRQLDRRAGG